MLVVAASKKVQYYLPEPIWSTTCDFGSHWNLLLFTFKSAPLIYNFNLLKIRLEKQFAFKLSISDD